MKINPVFSIASALLLVSALGFSTARAQDPAAFFSTYENPAHSFRMAYPSFWNKTAASSLGADVAFVFPVPAGDLFEENLNLVVRRAPAGSSLKSYSSFALAQIRDGVPEAAIVEDAPDVLGGRPAHRAVFTGRMSSLRMKWMQVWTIHGGKLFIFTYSAEAEHYDRSYGAVRKSIDTFEFSTTAVNGHKKENAS